MKYNTTWNILDMDDPALCPRPGKEIILYSTWVDYSSGDGKPFNKAEIVTTPIIPDNSRRECAILWAYWPPTPIMTTISCPKSGKEDARELPAGPDGTGNLCP